MEPFALLKLFDISLPRVKIVGIRITYWTHSQVPDQTGRKIIFVRSMQFLIRITSLRKLFFTARHIFTVGRRFHGHPTSPGCINTDSFGPHASANNGLKCYRCRSLME